MSKLQEYYKRKELEKYAFGLSINEREILNSLLDEVDAGKKTQDEIYNWLKETYNNSHKIHYLCESCSNIDKCHRVKEKIKTCKLYESEENQ